MKIHYHFFWLLILSILLISTGCTPKTNPNLISNTTDTFDTSTKPKTRPAVKWMTLPDYGTILVTNENMTLYRKNGPCDATCEKRWIPLMRHSDYSLPDETGFSYIQRGTGDSQIAYNKLPLYYFSQDQIPGDIKGLSESSQWHLVQPDVYTNETKDSKQNSSDIKEFKIAARQWEFVPNKISVHKNDRVRLIITSTDVEHGFRLEAFNIDEKIKPHKTTIIEFIADKTGEFPFFCNVFCGRGHADMTGVFIVK